MFQRQEAAQHQLKVNLVPWHLHADTLGGRSVQARPEGGHAMTAILNQSCDALIF